jgi:hypothetical protein
MALLRPYILMTFDRVLRMESGVPHRPTAATEVDFFRRLLLAMLSAICRKGCTTIPSAAV